ncbi:MAG: lytic transglycosylase domain-containing protein [Caulobacteraceae bacterium]|nr:MAG: lytic transglycosylase domain-containing protein [Caulobacteraceae bacterium]
MVAAGVRLFRGAAALIVAVLALGLISAPALAAEGPLSKPDEARYRAAFAAAERGDFEAADEALEKVRDRSLIGHVQFVKLMHPTAYRATYSELTDWLGDYAHLGGAERVYNLAQKRQPRGAKPPKAPLFLDEARAWMQAGPDLSAADASFAARDAYYSGRTAEAWALAPSAGEPWIAGLAGWRLGKVSEAGAYFRQVAEDDGNDDWLRSAAWFWAGRCAERLGDRAAAHGYFRRAAGTPYTFYGLIATRKLELDGGRTLAMTIGQAAPPPAVVEPPAPVRNPLLIQVSNRDVRKAEALVERDERALRAAALMQIDRPMEAAQELRVGLALARSETSQNDWKTLAAALKAPMQVAAAPTPVSSLAKKKARPYRAEPYDVPELYPDGGFTLDKALVYALVRQESRFNPYAYSHAGAVGLMQVRPTSAAEAAGDDHLLYNIMPLFDPPVNLRIGQDYMSWLMKRGLGGGDDSYDLFRVVAAYNGGAGAVIKTRKRMEADADALLFMESLPARETREYVEKVAFGYWTYRRMWGQQSPTLDQAARYDRLVDLRSDN